MNLNDAAFYTKRISAYLIIFVILYIFSENILGGVKLVYTRVFPAPPNPPQVKYGQIEKLQIPTIPVDLENVEYNKELPVSGFPEFPKNVNVYKIQKPQRSVIKEEKLKEIARDLGFNQPARKLSDSKRIWYSTNSQRQMTADVFNESFQIQTKNLYLEETLTKGNAPNNQRAVESARGFFNRVGYYNTDIQEAEYKVVPVTIEEGIVKETQLPFEEYLKFVNIEVKKTAQTTYTTNDRGERVLDKENKIKILTRNPYLSNIYTFVGKQGDNEITITDAKYNFYQIEEDPSTYPIIPANTAWERLTQEGASLVSIKLEGADYFANSRAINGVEQIDIRQMYLAYYLDSQALNYLQPIYVFKGKFATADNQRGDIFFYLPAINEQLNTQEKEDS